jgi:hypothetical protein
MTLYRTRGTHENSSLLSTLDDTGERRIDYGGDLLRLRRDKRIVRRDRSRVQDAGGIFAY